MLRLAYLGVAVVLAAGAGGCTLHFGGDDDGDDSGDDACTGTDDSLGAPLPDLLDPETLQCEAQSGTCNPCYEDCSSDDDDPAPTWAYCDGACDALSEGDCLLATECRAVYDYSCYTGDGPCSAEVAYMGCHGVDRSGPIEGGGCAGLGAEDCSRHNDCLALHTEQCTPTTDCWQQFVECVDENPITCTGTVVCDSLPPSCTDDSVPGVQNGCWSGTCIPVTECERTDSGQD